MDNGAKNVAYRSDAVELTIIDIFAYPRNGLAAEYQIPSTRD
jgi:hypothetical protein